MKKEHKIIIILLLVLVILNFIIVILLGKNQRNNFDVNNDGKVDILDLLLIKKYIIENGNCND